MLVDSKSAIFFNTVDKYYDNCFRSYCKLLSNYSYNLLPEHVAIIRDNLDYLTPSDCKVFNIVARKQSKYFKTFPSIKEIARAAGVSISTVKRALKKLVALGLIESITHQFMTRTSKWWSNVYKIGAWIYHPDLTATMAKYFFIFIGNLFPKSGYLQARLPEPNEPLLYRDMNISNQSLCIKHNSLKKTVIAGAKKVYKTCSQIIGGISRGATTIAQEVNTLLQRQDVSPNCQREEIIKKPGIIEHKTVVDIPEILKNDKLMGLTLAGKVKLSVYPVSALEEVLYQFKNRPSLIDLSKIPLPGLIL